MIIETTINGRPSFEGKNWIFYIREGFNELTNVFYELKTVARKNKEISFEELKDILDTAYINKKSRSDCRLSMNEKAIEICKPNKIMPHYWVVKTQSNETP